MPFIIIPKTGGVRGGKLELHHSYSKAQEGAAMKAKESPGTIFQVYATVATVHVPIPDPIWNEEQYVPNQLK